MLTVERRLTHTNSMLSESPDPAFLRIFQRLFDLSDTVFVESPRRNVFRCGNAVVKFGTATTTYEVEVLRFIREKTTVPVPRVYGVYCFQDGTRVVISEYIEGKPLSETWSTLSHEEKLEICGQLRQIVQKLRENRKDHYIGGIGNTVAIDYRKAVLTGGPFTTEEQFNTFLRSDLFPTARRRLHSTFQEIMSSNHEIVLTHSDISLRNIIVQNGQIKALIDWEYAGWYPEYWEYVRFYHQVDEPDLDGYVENIFPRTYPQELAIDLLLGQCLRHS